MYQDGGFGVVGILRNTFSERPDYQAQAELLMDRHFPEDYEIVRAEEVANRRGSGTRQQGNWRVASRASRRV